MKERPFSPSHNNLLQRQVGRLWRSEPGPCTFLSTAPVDQKAERMGEAMLLQDHPTPPPGSRNEWPTSLTDSPPTPPPTPPHPSTPPHTPTPGSHSPWLVRQKIQKNKALALKRSFQLRVNSTSEASRGVTFKLRKGRKKGGLLHWSSRRTTQECACCLPAPHTSPSWETNKFGGPKVAGGGGGGGGGVPRGQGSPNHSHGE